MIQHCNSDRFTYVQAVHACRRAWPGHVASILVPLIGRFTSLGGFSNRNREHDVIPHVVAQGRGTMSVAGRSWNVGPGDIFVFFPGHEVQYADAPGEPWHYTWFRLEGPDASAIMAMCGFTPDQPHRSGGFSTHLAPILDEGFANLGREHGSAAYPELLAWQLVNAIQEVAGTANRPKDLADRLRQHLDEHACSEISLSDLAARWGVDRSTLFRRFHAAYGCSPTAYILQERLSRALEMLTQPGITVAEVAKTCGFPSIPYFTRRFRASFGVPPGRWRNAGDLARRAEGS
ncbi:hypothetical protein LBMAG53_25460 [Planctomycetota bacterium]|nr:hypothetical protein LBMAG53_25460 [Planctomycetota bacterium]